VIGTEGFREQYAEEKVKELILSSKLPTVNLKNSICLLRDRLQTKLLTS